MPLFALHVKIAAIYYELIAIIIATKPLDEQN